MNAIKISILACFFIIFYQNLQAQEPCWFKTPPICQDPNFVYQAGIGQDGDAVKKKNRAEAEAIKTYMSQVHGIQLEDATYKNIVENGLEKLIIPGRPLQYRIVRQEGDGKQNDIFYTLLLLPKNFLREEIRRDIVFPDERLCDAINPPPVGNVKAAEPTQTGGEINVSNPPAPKTVSLRELKISDHNNSIQLRSSRNNGWTDRRTDIFDRIWLNVYVFGCMTGRDGLVEFVLDKKYKSFKVTLVTPEQQYNSDYSVEISGDTKILYKSPILNQKVQAINVVLDVTGQTFLRITSKSLGSTRHMDVLLAEGSVSTE